jgi:Na+/proline symporter
LGGRSVGPWLSAVGYGTAYFSAVVFVGFAGQFGWRFGISAIWIGLGNAFIGALLSWVVLGRRTRTMTQHLGSATMPEFFNSRYESVNLKKLSAIIVFVFMIPYSASIFNGLSRIFAMAFDIDFRLCIIIMAAIAGFYVVIGGYMATVINDAIQGSITLIGVIMIITAVISNYGGFMGALDSLAHIPADPGMAVQSPGVFASIFGPDPISLVGVVILTSLGVWGLPQMLQKFYAVKNEQAIMPGAVMSTAFCLCVA